MDEPTSSDYQRLLAFRDGLRRFLAWSEAQARAAGLTPSLHQMLLAVAGHGSHPSVSDLAGHLLLRHHSVVELVDKASEMRLVRRESDANDQRVVRIHLTPKGAKTLAGLASVTLEELSRIGPSLSALWTELPD